MSDKLLEWWLATQEPLPSLSSCRKLEAAERSEHAVTTCEVEREDDIDWEDREDQ